MTGRVGNSLEVSREDVVVASRVEGTLTKCYTSIIFYTVHLMLRVLLTVPAPVIAERGVGGSFFFFASPDIYFSHLSCFAPTTPAYPLDNALASVVFAMPTIGPLGYVLCPLLATWLTPSLQNHQVLHGPSRPQI